MSDNFYTKTSRMIDAEIEKQEASSHEVVILNRNAYLHMLREVRKLLVRVGGVPKEVESERRI